MNKLETKKFSIKNRLKSFKYAFNGIHLLFKHEHNARIHVVVTILVISLGIITKLSRPEWGLVILAIGLVFMAEFMNSAIEKLIDIVVSEKNDVAGKVKDIAAGGVLIASISAAGIGLLVFIPHLINLF